MRDALKSVFDNDYQGYPIFLGKVIRPIFGDELEVFPVKDDITIDIAREALKKANIRSIYRVAQIDSDTDVDVVEVFDVTLEDNANISRSRVGIQRIIRSRVFQFTHAFMIFHYENPEGRNWRFSYAYKRGTQADTTEAKRYTYLFGKNLHCRTAIDRFVTLAGSKKDNKALLEAFSVEALSDEFFDTYRKQYAKFVRYITGKEYVKEGSKWVEKQTGAPNEKIFSAFGNNEKTVRDYIKKLMGRITFLHFLQRKGWLCGDYNYMLNLFKKSNKKDDYLDAVLEPLFFGILNTKPEKRKALFAEQKWDSSLLKDWAAIPYLNGGLFEADDEDSLSIKFPKDFFSELLEFYSEYNFTVDENDPDDAEVGVDPEMLGKIFENLLEDNKDKGAFYTPKEIVRYMCQESLIAYLVEKSGIEEAQVRAFVTNPYEEAEKLAEKDIDTLFDALVAVKICDPAIGSGAFPMGLLNELVRCEEALVLGKEENRDRAHLKREIIKNNIYGVDIEKGAIDIARLRFWLSLVVDEDTPSPLPNLDYKIMQGNSLLESYKGLDLSHILDGQDGLLNFGESIREELNRKIEKYYSCTDHQQKKQLQHDINELVHQQIVESGQVVEGFENIDVAANQDFFLWHTWFSDVFNRPQGCNGFDIVIGNPPYISAPAQVDNEVLAQQRERIVLSKQYKTLYQKWDLYIPFIELGLQRLAPRGVFSMIVPYPLTNQTYALKMRDMILSEYNLYELVDLNGVKVFENATVSNCIPFVKKENSSNKTVRVSKVSGANIQYSHSRELNDMVQSKKRIWNLVEGQTSSEYSGFALLGDLCYISVGMVLNSDEKCDRGAFKKDDLISTTRDEIHSRKYIEAKDIEPYRVKRYRWLEWNTERCPNQLRRPTFRELYDCEKLLVNRLGKIQVYLDSEEHFLHSDSMFAIVLWHILGGVDNKSITSSIKKYSRLAREEMEALSTNVDSKYLLAVLNSSFASHLLDEQRGGDYHIYPEHLRQIPIPIPDLDVQKGLSSLVDELVSAIDAKDSVQRESLQLQIDNKVEILYQSN